MDIMSKKYSGMTVNERLYASGKMDEFDRAIEEKNKEKVKAILMEVQVDEASINDILKEYGLVS
jgi:molecular chaperone GrpE (heat shock protein)